MSVHGIAVTRRTFHKKAIGIEEMERSATALVAVALIQCLKLPELGQFSCIKEAPGFYCTNDLTGYIDCSQSISIKKNCSKGTKCSCFINTKCTIAESEICKAYPSPPKLSEDFDYTFFYKDFLTTPNSVVKNDQRIRIIRNTDLKKLWARTWDMKTLEQTFVVMVPSGNKSLLVSVTCLIILFCLICGVCSVDNFLSPIFSPYLFEHVTSRVNGASSQYKRMLFCNFIYFLDIFLLFFIKKNVFLSLSFLFFDEVSNFRNRILTSQKPE